MMSRCVSTLELIVVSANRLEPIRCVRGRRHILQGDKAQSVIPRKTILEIWIGQIRENLILMGPNL